jgi:cysteine desulfuration protein SufE
MNPSEASASQRLQRIAEEFADLDLRERLELLLEFADRLPPLPPKYRAEREAGKHRVHECQSPVFLWAELGADLRFTLIADVAPEAPTVKGFVSLLCEAFNGAPVGEVLAVEPNVVQRLGLTEALGMQRMRGLHGILFAVRRHAQTALDVAGENR